MDRVPRSRSHVGRLVDEHSVHRLDVGAAEAFQIWLDGLISAEGEENIVLLPVLDFRDGVFTKSSGTTFLYKRNITDNLN